MTTEDYPDVPRPEQVSNKPIKERTLEDRVQIEIYNYCHPKASCFKFFNRHGDAGKTRAREFYWQKIAEKKEPTIKENIRTHLNDNSSNTGNLLENSLKCHLIRAFAEHTKHKAYTPTLLADTGTSQGAKLAIQALNNSVFRK